MLNGQLSSIEFPIVLRDERFDFWQRLGRLRMSDDDLGERGKFRAIRPGLGLPEFGSGHALWAVYERLFDSDDEDKTWRFAGNCEAFLQGRISNNPSLARDSHCVAMARYHEDQRDIRTFDDVQEGIEAMIPDPVGYG